VFVTGLFQTGLGRVWQVRRSRRAAV